MRPSTRLRCSAAALAIAGAFTQHTVLASGFALSEQSASGLGNAYAGAAAVAEDASTIWWNPAGMSKLSGRQVAVAAHWIMPSSQFHNGGSVAATGQALNGEGGDAGQSVVTPAAYFVTDMAPRWKFGVALNVPFGLSTKYDQTWMGRFQGIDSEVRTLNINPSVSWAVNDTLSLGFGVNWQQATIDLLTAANYSGGWGATVSGALATGLITPAAAAGLSPLVPGGVEGQNRTKLDADAWGYNFGVLWDVTPVTRLGVAYRSSLKYHLDGNTSFSGRPTLPGAAGALGAAFNAATADGAVNMTLKTPDSLAVSAVHGLSSRWQLLGDVTWTGWSKVQSVPLVRDTGSTLDTLTFNFKDTLRWSVGTNYRYSDSWTLRAGYAYDQSPVPNAESRSVRLPDNDRQWIAFGAQYRLSRASAVDFGYAHLTLKDASINNNQNPPANVRGYVNGTYKASVDIVSAQFTYSF